MLHCNRTLAWWLECSSVAQESWVQSQVESYQRLKKWYLMLLCLILCIIRYVSRVVEQSREKRSTPLHLGVVAIEKGAFRLPSTKVDNFTYIYTVWKWYLGVSKIKKKLSLKAFRQLSSSLLLFPQRLGWYVLRSSSGVCRTREPSRNFELRPLLKPRGVTCSDSVSHNRVQVLSIPVLLLACSEDWTCNLQMIVSLVA